MADSWDELDQQFGGGTWRPTGESKAPASWDDLDRQTAKTIITPQRVEQVAEEPRVNPKDFEGQTLRIGPVDTKIPLPSSVNMGLAQLGSGIADLGLGYSQLFGKGTTADADEKKRFDAPLNKGIVGTVNNLVGKVAPFTAIPYGWAPAGAGAAGPIIEGLVGGGIQGALEPVGKGDSRATNTAVAAGFGSLLPAGVAIANKLTTTKDPARQALIDSALREGIPLSMADTSQNRLIKAFRSVANDLPFTGTTNRNLSEQQQIAFNKAMGRRWGSTAEKHTPDVRAADRARIGKVLDQVWDNNNLDHTANLWGDLRMLENRAKIENPGPAGEGVLNWIKDFESKMQQDAMGNLYMPGNVANNFQKEIFRKYGKGSDEKAQMMMDLRKSILKNFNEGITGPEAKALGEARGQWRAYKSLEDALVKGDYGVAQRQIGDIRPVDASAGILRNYGSARNPFGDLPQIGQQFLRDTSPQTGGSARALVQNSMVGASALGGLGWATNPFAAAGAAGTFIAANKAMNSPALRRLIQDPRTQRVLLDKPSMREGAEEALLNLIRRAPSQGALALPGIVYPPEKD